MKILLVKGLDNKFTCAYDSDYEKLKRIKPNEMIECDIKKKRNIKFHRKFFALLNMVYQNQEHYTNIDHLRCDLTVSAGFYEKRISFYGEEIVHPKSISFSKMDEHEFNEFYSAVLDEIVKHFNFDKQDIIDNVEQFF